MTDRIIEIADTAASLSLADGVLKITLPERPESRIPIAEIQCLILANPAVRISGAVLSALAERRAVVVVSGTDRMPSALQIPLCGNYLQTERFNSQINAPKPLVKRLWQCVVKAKVRSQGMLLKELYGDDFGVSGLVDKVNSGDTMNIEARAAVIYWKHIFKRPFVRDREARDNNLILNYGYAVLRAMTARACCGAGLHPTVGINHHNRYDPFCLADDLMEPFRWVVDKTAWMLNPENLPVSDLSGEVRRKILSALLEKLPTPHGMCVACRLVEDLGGADGTLSSKRGNASRLLSGY